MNAFEKFLADEEHLLTVVEKVAAVLQKERSFILSLEGPMGAGKTTFVREYLYRQGLNPRNPVVSPTYTLMNEYKVGEDWFAHLDLYRGVEAASLDEMGMDSKAYKGFFVEWMELAPKGYFATTHRLIIEPKGNERLYTMKVV